MMQSYLDAAEGWALTQSFPFTKETWKTEITDILVVGEPINRFLKLPGTFTFTYLNNSGSPRHTPLFSYCYCAC